MPIEGAEADANGRLQAVGLGDQQVLWWSFLKDQTGFRNHSSGNPMPQLFIQLFEHLWGHLPTDDDDAIVFGEQAAVVLQQIIPGDLVVRFSSAVVAVRMFGPKKHLGNLAVGYYVTFAQVYLQMLYTALNKSL